ncbi:MAG: hypothetical protein ACREKK_12520, partial [Candidatus Methylomirabilales bacterium]
RLGRAIPIWVRRQKCRPPNKSHVINPAFVLARRLDPVELIGPSLLRGNQQGWGSRRLALALDLPHTTVRDWRRRFRARAPTLAAGLAGVAVELGDGPPSLSPEPETAAFQGLGAAWGRTRERFGEAVVSLWRFAAAVTGTGMLTTTTTPLFFSASTSDWMAAKPTEEAK